MEQTISAALLQKMFLAGAWRLDDQKDWINELNVFPVPDGDTGTNMTMTIMAAVTEVAALAEPGFEGLSKAISSGSLRGARGNSGVIMSQLCRGFCKAIKEAERIDVPLLAAAMQRATETAYKAVMKPKEGTILTVARRMAEKAVELAGQEGIALGEMVTQILEEGRTALAQTPELLPVLKQAGVVDSGGQGLIVFLEGALDAFEGKEVPLATGEMKAEAASSGSRTVSSAELETSDIKFGYCTEFIINLEKPYGEAEEADLKAFLESIGDSIVCVSLDDIVKIHVHTNHPGQAFEKGLTLGSLSRMKVDNMRIEHQEKLFKESEKQAYMAAEEARRAAAQAEEPEEDVPEKEDAFVAVCAGEGLAEIFRELGADQIITGGQTMNPSTDDILQAAARCHAKNIYVLPNNKNIILAAEQAAKIEKDKHLIVVPTTTVPQGITALVTYVDGRPEEENLADMQEAIGAVKTGQVTFAVRNTTIQDREIHEGDFMGLGDGGLLAVGQSIRGTTLDMIGEMVDEESGVLTVYYGEGVSEDDAQSLLEELNGRYPDLEVELEYGGQPVYYYMVSVE